MMKYEALMNEVECIRNAWGFDFLEALEYIQENTESYRGTKVFAEFGAFCADAMRMFEPA